MNQMSLSNYMQNKNIENLVESAVKQLKMHVGI